MAIRCGMFGHQWELYADMDERALFVQRCARCKAGRRLKLNVGKGFWEKFPKKSAQ